MAGSVRTFGSSFGGINLERVSSGNNSGNSNNALSQAGGQRSTGEFLALVSNK
jgi:hypothetical protein